MKEILLTIQITFILISFTNCSLFRPMMKHHDLKEKCQKILSKNKNLIAECASKLPIEQIEKNKIIDLNLIITIEDHGKISSVKSGDPRYTSIEFLPCVYQKLLSLDFPKLKSKEQLHIELPVRFEID
jgi:hypothetical protein